MPLRQGQRTLSSCSMLLLALLVLAAPARPSDVQAWSGQELLNLCGRVDAAADPGSSCHRYFAGVLRGVDGRLWSGQRGTCPPSSFNVSQALALFRSEAGIYPEVLHVPASELIQGMMLKFFPCRGV